MKLIFLIALVLIFSIASSKLIQVKKSLARTSFPERVALELEFYGTCQEIIDGVLPSVWISTNTGGCLPITVGAPNADVNNLNSHYFCTRLTEERSVIHFVEIYSGPSEFAEDPRSGAATFVLSLLPNSPFRIWTPRTSVARRPDCFITTDYCNDANSIVNSCVANQVVYRSDDRDGHRDGDRHNNQAAYKREEIVAKKNDEVVRGGDRHNNNNNYKNNNNRRGRDFIVSKDRIYISVGSEFTDVCKTAEIAIDATTSCCAYVAPSTLTENAGICEHHSSDELLSFDRHHEQHSVRPVVNNSYGNNDRHGDNNNHGSNWNNENTDNDNDWHNNGNNGQWANHNNNNGPNGLIWGKNAAKKSEDEPKTEEKKSI